MPRRFPDLDDAAAADLEREYLAEIRRVLEAHQRVPSFLTVHGVDIDGEYPDTQAVVALTDERDGIRREMRADLWGDDCQRSYEIPQDPPHLAVLFVTAVYEEAAC